jgi:hypothetical protein
MLEGRAVVDRLAVRDDRVLERQLEQGSQRRETRSSCQGVPQTRSSTLRSVGASANASARCSGTRSGVSFRPRPS